MKSITSTEDKFTSLELPSGALNSITRQSSRLQEDDTGAFPCSLGLGQKGSLHYQSILSMNKTFLI